MAQPAPIKTQYVSSSYIDRGRLEGLLGVLNPVKDSFTVERRMDVWMINAPQTLSKVCRRI